MSLESFIGFDQAGEGSSAALEALRERMKAAAAAIAAIKKEEGKQKKKEADLAKILLRFVKTSHKKQLVLLISRVLEQNIPANFVLAIVLLGNEDIQAEVGRFLMLEAGRQDSQPLLTGEHHANAAKALVFFSEEDDTLPLKLKIEIDNWIKNMLSQAEETPQKLLKSAYDIEMIELEKESAFDEPRYDEKKSIKTVLVQLVAFVLREFLEQNSVSEPYEKLQEFSGFILKGILDKTAESLENRHLLSN